MPKAKKSTGGKVTRPSTGSLALRSLDRLLSGKLFDDAQIFILTDESTFRYCLPVLVSQAERTRHCDVITIAEGEANKDLLICEGIWNSLADSKADRNSVLLNLGGGMVTDIGGFVASTYMRGIRYINIPTSLMGMVDASFGGKTGINLGNVKNMIGTFCQPSGVYIYPGFLETIPPRQLAAAFPEMLKNALIAGDDFASEMKLNAGTKIRELTRLIQKSVQIKMSVVEADPMEKGIRKSLNFGHTVGHAIETASLGKGKHPFLHGEAVGVGLICESWLSFRFAGMEEWLLKEISTAIGSFFPLKKLPLSPAELIGIMTADKKNSNGSIRFSLLTEPGRVITDQECPEKMIEESLAFYNTFI